MNRRDKWKGRQVSQITVGKRRERCTGLSIFLARDLGPPSGLHPSMTLPIRVRSLLFLLKRATCSIVSVSLCICVQECTSVHYANQKKQKTRKNSTPWPDPVASLLPRRLSAALSAGFCSRLDQWPWLWTGIDIYPRSEEKIMTSGKFNPLGSSTSMLYRWRRFE